MDGAPYEYPIGKQEGMRLTGTSSSTFERRVNDGTYPKPFYPSPRVRRWWPSELRAAVDSRRMLPAEAKEKRRQARLVARRCEQ